MYYDFIVCLILYMYVTLFPPVMRVELLPINRPFVCLKRVFFK